MLCEAALDVGPAHLPCLVGQEHSLGVTNSLLLSWPSAAAQIPFGPKPQGVPLPLAFRHLASCASCPDWHCKMNPERCHSLQESSSCPTFHALLFSPLPHCSPGNLMTGDLWAVKGRRSLAWDLLFPQGSFVRLSLPGRCFLLVAAGG